MPKKVVLMGSDRPPYQVGAQFEVSHFNPLLYIDATALRYSHQVDNLWRSGNASYHRMLDDFLRLYGDFDIIVCNLICAFHPEWLWKHFPKAVKIYGCIDDPTAAYDRRIAYLWAFDGAFYISPSYDRGLPMERALALWGMPHRKWWPLSKGVKASAAWKNKIQKSWSQRTHGLCYVGAFYLPKLSRLSQMKKALGAQFSVYGRWSLKGFAGFAGPLYGQKMFPHRVRPLSFPEREEVYMRAKIGLNMHWSDRRETGNMRFYEAPFHGMMLLSDKAADDLHASILVPDKEAVFYDSIEDAIELAKFYLKHDSLRQKIAEAGFERVCRDYDEDKCFLDFLNWAGSLKPRQP